MNYTYESLMQDTLMPYRQALVLQYALNIVDESYFYSARRILNSIIDKYEEPWFLPMVDDEQIDRIECCLNRYFSQTDANPRLSEGVCRMIATLHIPGVLKMASKSILEEFEEHGQGLQGN